MRHFDNIDVFGAARTNRAILVQLKDPGRVARNEGAIASFATEMAPASIEGMVYDVAASKIRDALAEQHVEADVSIVEPGMYKPATTAGIMAADIGYMIGGAGVLAGLTWLITRAMKAKK